MKQNIHISLTILLILIVKIGYSQQVAIEINSMYDGTSYIDDCGTIDFGSNTTLNINFWVKLEKPSNYSVGDGELKIYKVPYSGAFPDLDSSISYTSSAWNGNFIDAYYNIELSASFFETSGGRLYAEFHETGVDPIASCSYSIIKDELPSFTISPSSTTVDCGSTALKTFTINDQNVPTSSTLSYNWVVGNTWNHNGSPAGSFTTTSNSVTLEPNTYPPANVKVTPVLDGTSYPQLTSNVSLSSFTGSFYITGASSVYSNATYSINNLPAGYTVSWSSSNTNLAQISSINDYQAQVTANGNGTATINATITNTCSQQLALTPKNINIGSPTFSNGGVSGDNNPLTGEQKWYSVPPATGAISYLWYFNIGGQTGTNVDGWSMDIIQDTSIYVTVGNPGLAYVVCKALNGCGSTISYMPVVVRSTSDPCDEMLRLSSNPVKSDEILNKVILIDDPCDETWYRTNSENTKFTISILNSFGRSVYRKTQNSREFDIPNLKKGFCISVFTHNPVIPAITSLSNTLSPKYLLFSL